MDGFDAAGMSGSRTPVTQNGYTLVEVLGAVLVLGLAMAGLSQALYSIGRVQERTTREVALARAAGEAERLMARSIDAMAEASERSAVSATSSSVTSTCDGKPCALRVETEGRRTAVVSVAHGRVVRSTYPEPGLGLAFVTPEGFGRSWSGGSREPMPAVQLVQGERIIAYHRPVASQSAACVYDPSSRRCVERAR